MREANPLLDDVFSFRLEDKKFVQIGQETTAKGYKVFFRFSDGTREVREYECDRATFIRWWHHVSAYLQSAADAFEKAKPEEEPTQE